MIYIYSIVHYDSWLTILKVHRLTKYKSTYTHIMTYIYIYLKKRKLHYWVPQRYQHTLSMCINHIDYINYIYNTLNIYIYIKYTYIIYAYNIHYIKIIIIIIYIYIPSFKRPPSIMTSWRAWPWALGLSCGVVLLHLWLRQCPSEVGPVFSGISMGFPICLS